MSGRRKNGGGGLLETAAIGRNDEEVRGTLSVEKATIGRDAETFLGKGLAVSLKLTTLGVETTLDQEGDAVVVCVRISSRGCVDGGGQ
jgi:hypothetical protein